MSQAHTAPVSKRDMRLDVFRGICLIMIFINHVPGNLFENFTSRNFGWSDAAEGFVFMSGVSAGLAYSLDFRESSMRLWTGLARVWRRVWTLYLVHITVTVAALAAACAVSLWLGNGELLFMHGFRWLWKAPREAVIGIIFLTQQFGYLNILPLYTVLLAFAPIPLFLVWRAQKWLLFGSIALWLIVGTFRWSIPNWPSGGTWFFNPMSWQLLFVIGLMTGVALKQGHRLVPKSKWLLIPALFVLGLAFIGTQVSAVSKGVGYSFWLLKEYLHFPFVLTSFDKGYLCFPRLMHILSLAYVISYFDIFKRFSALPAMIPLANLGRQSLPVFALGSVTCIGFQALRKAYETSVAEDAMLLAIGLAMQFALAYAKIYWPKPHH